MRENQEMRESTDGDSIGIKNYIKSKSYGPLKNPFNLKTYISAFKIIIIMSFYLKYCNVRTKWKPLRIYN